MGVGTSLLALYEVARVVAPTFVDAIAGRVERETIDQRAREFGERMIKRAEVQLEVIGRERVPTDRAFVYMSNHKSHVDIPVLFATVPARTLRMVSKKELFDIPLFGKAMRGAGFVEVDRGNRQKAVQSLRHAEAALKDGISIWIAPEGTRSVDGRIGPLKKGGFHLATSTRTPIVPVALLGTDRVLPAHGRSMTRGVAVKVTFGAPIPSEQRSVAELMDEVRGFLEAHGTDR